MPSDDEDRSVAQDDDEIISDAVELELNSEEVAETELFATYESLLTAHYENYLGPTSMVFRDDHSNHSDAIKVNIHVYPASEERPFLTLVTAGMGLRKMNVHDQVRAIPSTIGGVDQKEDAFSGTKSDNSESMDSYSRAELMLYLPEDWDFGGPDGYVPFELLLKTARYPHRESTWLGVGHTVSNGEQFQPFFEGSLLCAGYFLPAVVEEEEFFHVDLTSNAHLHVLWLQPITIAERHYKRVHGSQALNEKLVDGDVFLLDVDRPCTVMPENRAERRAREKAQRRRRRAPRETPWGHIVCAECYGTFLDVLSDLAEDDDTD